MHGEWAGTPQRRYASPQRSGTGVGPYVGTLHERRLRLRSELRGPSRRRGGHVALTDDGVGPQVRKVAFTDGIVRDRRARRACVALASSNRLEARIAHHAAYRFARTAR